MFFEATSDHSSPPLPLSTPQLAAQRPRLALSMWAYVLRRVPQAAHCQTCQSGKGSMPVLPAAHPVQGASRHTSARFVIPRTVARAPRCSRSAAPAWPHAPPDRPAATPNVPSTWDPSWYPSSTLCPQARNVALEQIITSYATRKDRPPDVGSSVTFLGGHLRGSVSRRVPAPSRP